MKRMMLIPRVMRAMQKKKVRELIIVKCARNEHILSHGQFGRFQMRMLKTRMHRIIN